MAQQDYDLTQLIFMDHRSLRNNTREGDVLVVEAFKRGERPVVFLLRVRSSYQMSRNRNFITVKCYILGSRRKATLRYQVDGEGIRSVSHLKTLTVNVGRGRQREKYLITKLQQAARVELMSEEEAPEDEIDWANFGDDDPDIHDNFRRDNIDNEMVIAPAAARKVRHKNGKKRKIRRGPRGGRFIMRNRRKVYLSSLI
jgi:hypothetical protein